MQRRAGLLPGAGSQRRRAAAPPGGPSSRHGPAPFDAPLEPRPEDGRELGLERFRGGAERSQAGARRPEGVGPAHGAGPRHGEGGVGCRTAPRQLLEAPRVHAPRRRIQDRHVLGLNHRAQGLQGPPGVGCAGEPIGGVRREQHPQPPLQPGGHREAGAEGAGARLELTEEDRAEVVAGEGARPAHQLPGEDAHRVQVRPGPQRSPVAIDLLRRHAAHLPRDERPVGAPEGARGGPSGEPHPLEGIDPGRPRPRASSQRCAGRDRGGGTRPRGRGRGVKEGPQEGSRDRPPHRRLVVPGAVPRPEVPQGAAAAWARPGARRREPAGREGRCVGRPPWRGAARPRVLDPDDALPGESMSRTAGLRAERPPWTVTQTGSPLGSWRARQTRAPATRWSGSWRMNPPSSMRGGSDTRSSAGAGAPSAPDRRIQVGQGSPATPRRPPRRAAGRTPRRARSPPRSGTPVG